MAEFDWMVSHVRVRAGATAATHDDEIRRRAALFATLGYPLARAEARLRANVLWEYERVGKPAILKRLSGLVAEAYKRAGRGKAIKKKR